MVPTCSHDHGLKTEHVDIMHDQAPSLFHADYAAGMIMTQYYGCQMGEVLLQIKQHEFMLKPAHHGVPSWCWLDSCHRVNCITDRVRVPFLGMFCCSCMLSSCHSCSMCTSVVMAAAAVADGYANPKSLHWHCKFTVVHQKWTAG